MKAHSDELCVFINNCHVQPSIICLTETWLSDEDDVEHLLIPGYQSIITKNRHTRGGGVGVYLLNSIASELSSSSGLQHSERLHLELNVGGSLLSLVVIYRPPTSSVTSFCNEIDNLLEQLNQSNKNALIIGDMNLNLRQSNSSVTEYLNIIESNGFHQLVHEPTRVTQNTASILDHIITNYNYMCDIRVHKTDITDHYPIEFRFQCLNRSEHKILKRNLKFLSSKEKQCFLTSLRSKIEDIKSIPDVNSQCMQLNNNIISILDEYAPKKPLKDNKARLCPWSNNRVKNILSRRDAAMRKHKNEPENIRL